MLKIDEKALAAYAEEIKKNKAGSAVKNKTKRKFNFWKWILGWFVHRSLLELPRIHMGHLNDAPDDLSVQSIKRSIRKALENLLLNSKKHSKLLKEKTSIFGLYKLIITEVIKWDKAKLSMLDVGYGISLLGFILILVYFCLPFFFSHDSGFSTALLLLVLFCCISLVFLTAVVVKEEKLKIKSKIVIQQLVYEKLLVSDMHFLEHADNNYIHQLLYSELDEFVDSLVERIPWTLVIIFAGLVIGMSIKFHFSLLAIFLGVGWIVFISKLVQTFIRRPYLQHKTISFEERKVFYELISNFQSFTLKNLKPRYSTMLDRLRQLRLQKASVLNTLRRLTPEHTYINFGLMLFIGPLAAYISLKYGYTLPSSFIGYWYFPTTLTYFLLQQAVHLYAIKLPAHDHSSISRSLYDGFFDNHFIVEARPQTDSTTLGTIAFEDCYILERYSGKQSGILKRPNSLLADLLKENDKFMKKEEELQRKQSYKEDYNPIASINLRFLQYAKSKSSEDGNKQSELTLIFAGLSLKIEPGKRVCIFDNKNHRQIKGFLRAIMQENQIAMGTLKVGGTVSYLNAKKKNFQVGRTIRDNIIFGQDFDQIRYDWVLKAIGVSFSNYFGQDLYQLNEEGHNLRDEDRRYILLARFLYNKCDIYLIEDYFHDLNVSLQLNQICQVFETILKHKTLVFVSNELEALWLSETIICFEGERDIHVVATNRYLTFLEATRRAEGKTRRSLLEVSGQEGRVEVLQRKFKNCIFVANISYEEELKIYKEQEKQRLRIERMRLETNNVLDFLAFGLYLHQKRKEEGIYLEDDMNSLTFIEAVKWIIKENDLTKITKSKWTFFLIFLIIEMVCQLLSEYLAMRLGYEIYLNQNSKFESVKFTVPAILSLQLLGKLLEHTRSYYGLKRFKALLEFIGVKAQTSILDSNIASVINKRSHRLLDCLCKEMTFIEIRATGLVRWGYQLIFEILSSFFILTFVLSLWSIPVLVLLVLAYYTLYLVVRPLFTSMIDLRSFILDKIADKHYELLNLIGAFRITRQSEKLMNHLQSLGNNYVRCMNLYMVQFQAGFRTIINLLSLCSASGCLVLGVLCIYYPSANYFGVDKKTLFWSILYVGRLFSIQQALPNLVFSYVEVCSRFTRVAAFMKRQEVKEECLGGSLRNLSYSRPLIFSNVSLTIGLQPVLKRVTFKIEAGSRIAIVGAEGSGRSTIFEILTKVRKPDFSKENPATISLFGIDLDDLPENLIKEQIFVLERTSILFEGSVIENIDPYGSKADSAKEIMKKLRIGHLLRSEEMIQSAEELACNERIFVRERMSVFDLVKNASLIKKTFKQIDLQASIGNSVSKLESIQEISPIVTNKHSVNFSNIDTPISKFARQASESPGRAGFYSHGLVPISENLGVYSRKRSKANTDGQLISLDRNVHFHQAKMVGRFKDNPKHSQQSEKTEKPRVTVQNIRSPKRADSHGKPPRPLVEDRTIKTLRLYPTVQPNQRTQMLSNSKSSEGGGEQLSLIEVDLSREPLCEPQKAMFAERPGGSGSIHSKHEDYDGLLLRAIEWVSKTQLLEAADQKTKDLDEDKGSMSVSYRSPKPADDEADCLTDKMLDIFLAKKVNFRGTNIEKDVRKLILVTRVMISKPRLLLLYEDSLDFGQGVSWNLEVLKAELEASTIICIPRSSKNLLAYDQLLFLDAGKVVETGKPGVLLDAEGSWLNKYLTQVDPLAYDYLKNKKIDMEIKARKEAAERELNARREAVKSKQDEIEIPLGSLSVIDDGLQTSRRPNSKKSGTPRNQEYEHADTKLFSGQILKDVPVVIEAERSSCDEDENEVEVKIPTIQDEGFKEESAEVEWDKDLSEFITSERRIEQGIDSDRKELLEPGVRLPKSRSIKMIKSIGKKPGNSVRLPDIAITTNPEVEISTKKSHLDKPDQPKGQTTVLDRLTSIVELSEAQELAESKIQESKSRLTHPEAGVE